MIKYLEVVQTEAPAVPRQVLVAKQANLAPLDTVGIELVLPSTAKQSEWEVFFQGIPRASLLESDSLRPLLARVIVADEADARAAWLILKPWFDSAQVTIQLHEHNDGSPCVLADFNPEAQS